MITALEKKAGNTLEFTITLPWSEIEMTYAKIMDQLLGEIELPGFRKGKAPRNLAEAQIDKTRIYEEVAKELLPKAYAQAVKEHDAHPIISPNVEILEADVHKDWKVRAVTAEKPTITLGDYKKDVAGLHAQKKTKIWVPGEEKKEADKAAQVTVGEILDVLAKEIKIELSPLILDQEVNRQLSNLIDQTQKLGMTIEQYLQSQGKTSDQLRQEYKAQSEKTLALEFALEEIAERENIVIKDEEIEAVIKNAKTEAERTSLASQRYYIASLLRRQKTINSLLEPSPITV